jgi:hypothetical protein
MICLLATDEAFAFRCGVFQVVTLYFEQQQLAAFCHHDNSRVCVFKANDTETCL